MNFGKLILRKIIKIAATRCHILQLKCTKFDFGTPLWELTALPRPPSWIKGPTSKGRGGEGMGGEEKEWDGTGKELWEERGGERKGGEGKMLRLCQI